LLRVKLIAAKGEDFVARREELLRALLKRSCNPADTNL